MRFAVLFTVLLFAVSAHCQQQSYPPTLVSGVASLSSLDNIKFASQFLGADACAKVNAADTALGVKGGQIWLDHTAGTSCTTQMVLHNKLVFIDDFKLTLSGAACPISIPTGGVGIEGLGLDNTGGTQLATWIEGSSCAAGKDVISVLGTMANRTAAVSIKGVFVTCGNTARYGLRFEKTDLLDVEESEFQNCATAGVYGVDSTGDYFKNNRFANIPANGLVLDWGTGQFTGVGNVFESLVCNANPMLTVQGSGSGQSFYGTTMQLDGCTSTWGGFVSITGFDTNSSFASAPTGGAGAPVGPGFYNLNVTVATNGGNSSQGADMLFSGTATNPTQDVVLKQMQDFGNSFSTVAFKIDQSKGTKFIGGFSNGHTTATFNPTNNALYTQAIGVTSLDTATCAGTCPSGIAIFTSQATTGRWDLNNSYVTGDGASNLPAWSFSADTGNGFSRPGNNYIRYSSAGADILSLGTTGLSGASGATFGFTNGNSYTGTQDTGISRTAAGVVGIGTGANGSAAGKITDAGEIFTGSAPAITATGTTPYINASGPLIQTQQCSFSLTTSTFTLALSPVNLCTITLPNAAVVWRVNCQAGWSVTAGTTPTFAVGNNWAQTPSGVFGAANIYTTNAAAGLEGTTSSTANGNILATGTLGTSATIFTTTWWTTFTGSATSGAYHPTASLTGTSATGTLVGFCTIQ